MPVGLAPALTFAAADAAGRRGGRRPPSPRQHSGYQAEPGRAVSDASD